LGVNLPTVGLDHDRDFVIPVAQAAERLGFDSLWATDHVVLPYDRESRYPYGRSKTEIAMEPGMQWIDPMATLSFVAGVTETIRLGTSVLVLPYRNPVVLAGEAATLDVLSDSRLILGIGTGWMREEFEAIGVPPSERGARTDEALEVMRTLWRDDPASHSGRFWSFDDVVLACSPRSEGGPPVWIGGNTDPALRRTLRHGDAWHGFEIYPEDMPDIRDRLARLGEEAGRDPAELELTVVRGLIVPGTEEDSWIPGRRYLGGEHPTAESIVDELGRLGDEGVSMCLGQISALAPLVPDALEWVAAEILPKLDTGA
jgi:probable F420-dependent oxidoreductase